MDDYVVKFGYPGIQMGLRVVKADSAEAAEAGLCREAFVAGCYTMGFKAVPASDWMKEAR